MAPRKKSVAVKPLKSRGKVKCHSKSQTTKENDSHKKVHQGKRRSERKDKNKVIKKCLNIKNCDQSKGKRPSKKPTPRINTKSSQVKQDNVCRKSNHSRKNIQYEITDYQCKLCLRKFKNEYCLKCHEKRIHSVDKYRCEMCSSDFSRLILFNSHTRAHKCPDCGKYFCEKIKLEEHMISHKVIEFSPHGKVDVDKTLFIQQNSSDISQLKEHNAIREEVKNYHCWVCGKSFYTQRVLNRHMSNHKDQTDPCQNFSFQKKQPSFSGESVKIKEEISDLIPVYDNLEEQMPEMFMVNYFIKEMFQVIHVDESKVEEIYSKQRPYCCCSCEVCGTLFLNLSKGNHNSAYGCKKKHKCKVKSFEDLIQPTKCSNPAQIGDMPESEKETRQQNLGQEIPSHRYVVHTGERDCNFEEENEKDSSQNGEIRKIHLDIRGRKSFECQICGKTYSHKSDFERHILGCCDDGSEQLLSNGSFDGAASIRIQEDTLMTRALTNNESERIVPSWSRDQDGELFPHDYNMQTSLTSDNIGEHEYEDGTSVHCSKASTNASGREETSKKNGHGNLSISPANDKESASEGNRSLSGNGLELPATESDSNGVQVFTCGECEKSFTRLKDLKRHTVIHREKKSYQCEKCGKEFLVWSTYRRHMFVHKEVKKYKCKLCGLEFYEVRALRRHKLAHSLKCKQKGSLLDKKGKKFKCSDCGKCFCLKRSLEAHLVVHTGKKPYVCDRCGKDFFLLATYRQHLLTHTGIKTFKCKLCGKSFRRNNVLQKHMLDHSKLEMNETTIVEEQNSGADPNQNNSNTGKKFECKECGKGFNHKQAFNAHRVMHTGVKPFKCHDCGKEFFKRYSLRHHMLIHAGVKKFVCVKCGKGFYDSSGLKRHTVTHHKNQNTDTIENNDSLGQVQTLLDKKSTVDFEQDSTPTGPDLKLDVRDIECNKEKQCYTCKICRREFRSKGGLKDHEVLHSDKKPFKCEVCGNEYYKRNSYAYHMLTHSGVKKYKCEDCGKSYFDKYGLNKHRNKAHTVKVESIIEDVKPMKFFCDECGKGYHVKASLQAHAVMHSEKKPYKCELCGKEFYKWNSLKHHMLIHQGIKKYKCEECTKGFYDISGFRRHMLTNHKGHASDYLINNFQCDKCGKCFSKDSSLRWHMRVHNREKKYICDLCGKCFTKRAYLKQHGQVHAERTHKCEQCGQCFTASTRLKRHMTTHSKAKCKKARKSSAHKSAVALHMATQNERSNKCEICGKYFSNKRALWKHCILYHSCEKCGKNIFLKEDFLQHMMTHPKEKFECGECKKIFPNRIILKEHFVGHVGEKNHQCDECGKCFFEQKTLYLHKNVHVTHPEKENKETEGEIQFESEDGICVQPPKRSPQLSRDDAASMYRCGECGEAFAESEMLREHIIAHERSKDYHCQECGKSFSQYSTLKLHMIVHRQENQNCKQNKNINNASPMYHCLYCGVHYYHKKTLTLHLEQQHSDNQACEEKEAITLVSSECQHECKYCTEHFSSSEILIRHLAQNHKDKIRANGTVLETVQGKKVHICEDCGKLCNSKSKLKEHSVVHTGLKRFQCDECDKRFSQKSQLTTHKRIHTGEKKYECWECGKRFAQNGQLQRHLVRHTGERNFKCKVCNKQYSHKCNLKAHMDIHIGKRYKCKVCGKEYSQNVALKKHLLIHNDENVVTTDNHMVNGVKTHQPELEAQIVLPGNVECKISQPQSNGIAVPVSDSYVLPSTANTYQNFTPVLNSDENASSFFIEEIIVENSVINCDAMFREITVTKGEEDDL